MAQTPFQLDESGAEGGRRGLGEELGGAHYLGAYNLATEESRNDQRSVGNCSIVRVRSHTALSFRRSWPEVRPDAADVMVLWFVRRGGLACIHAHGEAEARPGDLLITHSLSACAIDCEPDPERGLDLLHVIVPTSLFRQFVTTEVALGEPMPVRGALLTIVEHLLGDLFGGGGELNDALEQRLIGVALGVLGEALAQRGRAAQPRQALSARRLQTVLRFVEENLTDQQLNVAKVSAACGISPRYLSHLLKRSGTSFFAHVWKQRLRLAHQMLASTHAADLSIAEIAARVGFKSAAHFARLFRQTYGVSPREVRGRRGSPFGARRVPGRGATPPG